MKDDPPGLVARAVRRLLLLLYRLRGWKAAGVVPEPRRFILIAAPHTSNWDFVNFLGLTADLDIRPHFMAKLSLFRWPLGGFIRQMGGVPVDRRGGSNVVEQMVRELRTGFYQIALAAKVPMVVGLMDYGTRTGGIGPLIWPSGDFRADMVKVLESYKNCVPRFPERAVRSIDDIVGADEEPDMRA